VRNIGLISFFLFTLLILACSKTTEPEQDVTPPSVNVQLSVYPVNSFIPYSFSFYATPRGSSDNHSSFDDLQIRWDFENDGEWDTEFQDMVSISDFVPSVLPVTTWFVKCELKDLAGNSTVHTEPYLLPEWLPTPPDILAGEIRLFNMNSRTTFGDTLQVGEEFYIALPRQDWLNEEGLHVTLRYYIDDQFLGENSTSTYYPNPNGGQLPPGFAYEGFQTLGVHEIRVELELSGDPIESNVENNSASRVVFIVE